MDKIQLNISWFNYEEKIQFDFTRKQVSYKFSLEASLEKGYKYVSKFEHTNLVEF